MPPLSKPNRSPTTLPNRRKRSPTKAKVGETIPDKGAKAARRRDNGSLPTWTCRTSLVEHEKSQDEGYEAGMGSLRQLGAFKSNNAPPISTKKELMFVNASINGKAVRAMLDTGATHNFVFVDEAKKVGLKATSEGGTIKTVNSPVKPIASIANAIPVCLGEWSMEFFDQVHAFPFPIENSLSILDRSKTCMVPAEHMAKVESKVLSVLQFKRGLKKDPNFLATIRELNDGEDRITSSDPTPAKVQAVLNEYKDIMPKEHLKKLPPRREVDHQIELEPRAKPPAMVPYRMAPPELEEL
ncbi:hypothetical protein EZV62_024159 [Acer yangbiense]|uniref:Aspartic peptidase DDI1-type domain-containing protein n=1 Tax=Acer yangbiense TaxID=1000413 RepID=A0A5C7H4P5_9ROSI|nr:hypothetical protein EZV62_024159 [Acer yangbiense]